MRYRKRPKIPTAEPGPPRLATPAYGWLDGRRYLSILVVCLGTALVLSLILAGLRRPDAASMGRDPGALSPTPRPTPTIELPDSTIEVSSEELRAELLRLGVELLQRFPESPEALHVVGLLYADLQKTTEAKEIWRKCVELAPRQVGPYVGLATAAMSLGEDETAVETLHKALQAGCSSAEIYEPMAAALTKLGRLEEAAAAHQQRLQALPHAAESWLQLGQVQIQLGQFAEAEASLQRAITEGLASETVYFALATACARQGKAEEAAKHRQEFSQRKAARESAGKVQFQKRYDDELRRIAVASLGRAGTVYDRQGDVTRAERLLLRAVSLEPDNAVVGGELGLFFRRQGRIADARLVQQRLVEIEPDNVAHLINLASLSSQLGDDDLAEAALKRVIGMRPERAIGYASLAQLYLKTGKSEQARWFAEAALRQETTNPGEMVTTYFVLAAACEELQDRPAAESALAKARQLVPNDPRLPPSGAVPP